MAASSSAIRQRKRNAARSGHDESEGEFSKSKQDKKTSNFRLLYVICIALALCLLQFHLLHSMFENDRFFSHLSDLEREMSFRTEMGMYYSYYKAVVGAPGLGEGLRRIMADNRTEYPSTINALQRFNILPEVVLGGGFRMFRQATDRLKLVTRTCFQVDRGSDLSPVQSCSGIGEPVLFYVNAVFLLNALYPGIIFALATFTSNSIFGGILSAGAFFFNMTECTRVMWTPPLRESFAMPFLFLQLMLVCYIIRSGRRGVLWSALLCLPTLSCMLPWQFTQFVMVTQCLAIGGLMVINMLPVGVVMTIIGGTSLAFVANIVLQFGNTMLLTSYLPACLLSLWIACIVHHITKAMCCQRLPVLRSFILLIMFLGITLVVKTTITMATGIKDDAHIWNLLKAKLTSYKDFHTQIYVCAPEFNFLELQFPVKLSLTLLLPTAAVVVLLTLRKVIPVAWKQIQQTDGNVPHDVAMTAESAYHLLQLSAFAVMAVMIMRLKLFLTPYLCLFAGMAASSKIVDFLKPRHHWKLLIALFVLSAIWGSVNINEMISIEGEYSNAPQEELLEWIQSHTNKNTVFAGAMPIMATVGLSTGRPTVNHPHYEDQAARDRTFKVYQIYGRTPAGEMYSILKEMGAEMIVVGNSWCYQRYRPGCAFSDIWSLVHPHHSEGNHTLFCDDVFKGSPHLKQHFTSFFRNSEYVVLRLV